MQQFMLLCEMAMCVCSHFYMYVDLRTAPFHPNTATACSMVKIGAITVSFAIVWFQFDYWLRFMPNTNGMSLPFCVWQLNNCLRACSNFYAPELHWLLVAFIICSAIFSSVAFHRPRFPNKAVRFSLPICSRVYECVHHFFSYQFTFARKS